MKIPDFHEYVYPAYDLDTCRTWCLVNCSCSAYALVNGIGCLTWSDGLVDVQQFAVGGEDLFLRLAPKELGENYVPVKKFTNLCLSLYSFPILDIRLC